MKSTTNLNSESQLMMVVFDNLEPAEHGVNALLKAGLLPQSIEVISNHNKRQRRKRPMPDENEIGFRQTTSGSMISGFHKWGLAGFLLGGLIGIVFAIVVANAIIALVMALVGGVTGALIGGVAGMEHAVLDDSIDLPSTQQYRQLLKQGCALLAINGSTEDLMLACQTLSDSALAKAGLNAVQGHEFHKYSPQPS